MSIKYKVVKQVFGFDKTNTVKYVARTVTGEMLSFDKVRKQVMQISGAHRGTVNLIIDGLLDVMMNNLDMGHSIQLGEFGVLRPAIRATSQNSEEAVTTGTIYRRKINFVPGKMLKSFLEEVSITRAGEINTDYTHGANSGNNDGDDGESEYIDPNA